MAGRKRKSGSEKQPKHRLPLGADADAVAAASKRRRSGAAKQHQADEEASIPSSLSAKILREARKQQQEEMLADSGDESPPAAAAAGAAAGPSTSSSFPVPTADDEYDDVDEFDGFDALSEYDGGESGRWRSTKRMRRPLLPSCQRTKLPSAHLVISFSRRSERRTPRSQLKGGLV